MGRVSSAVCRKPSSRDLLPAKKSLILFKETIYSYLGQSVTLKMVSLKADARFKTTTTTTIFRIQRLCLQRTLNNFKELAELQDLTPKD